MSDSDDVRKRAAALAQAQGLNMYVAIALTLQPSDASLNLIPYPPDLERGMGYVGEATYVAFYWHAQKDEAIVDDGQVQGAADVGIYQLFTHHPRITPFLQEVELGNSTTASTHALVLHRHTRQFQCRTLPDTILLLQQQWSFQSGSLSDATIRAMLQRLRPRDESTAQSEHWAIAEAIQEWLDTRVSLM